MVIHSSLHTRKSTESRASTHFLCLEKKYSINSKSYWQKTYYCNLKITALYINASVCATLCMWRSDNLQESALSFNHMQTELRALGLVASTLPLSHLTGPVIITLHNIYMMHVIFFKVENTTACVNFLQSFQSTLPSNEKMNEISFIVSSKIDNSLTVK